jgi:hypothetical protein
LLFATNFRGGTVEAYDSIFKPATTSAGSRTKAPRLPRQLRPVRHPVHRRQSHRHLCPAVFGTTT